MILNDGCTLIPIAKGFAEENKDQAKENNGSFYL